MNGVLLVGAWADILLAARKRGVPVFLRNGTAAGKS
jgi:hypothetical protein